ncbi:Equilibrative nucleotide transporter 4 [Hibiscus syriacus]|uniref:Equilibrative nucleotide transporter 4 n=1 Tax=Hibiscus syriacus TaxID=106335 RepID=A0A6A2XBG0_HIBSY|nr:equilibrative nucleotide transporter 3-like [Hibiscus syriacus]KAE8672903.1 Equilibrative nucleotide transporter 4 [Hibiscus syriacus]
MRGVDGGESLSRLEGKFRAMVICWVLGFGSLISWNSVLTMGDYYYHLFPNYHPLRMLPLVNQLFSFGATTILTYNESTINTRWRNISGYLLYFASTFMLIVLDVATSGRGGLGSFVSTCAIVAVFGAANALVQGGMIGDLSFMLPVFMQSFLAGLAAAGTLTSGLRLITKAAFEMSEDGVRKGTMLFLAISTFFQLLCILLYTYFFPKLPVVKYFRAKAASEGLKTVLGDLAAAGIETQTDPHEDSVKQVERLSNKQLFYQNIDYALDLFLIFALTLSIFPGFLYEDTGKHKLGTWYPLVLVAVFNTWDLISRYFPLVELLKIESRKWLMIATLSCFLLVSAFYFTGKYGDQGWMIFLVSFLGLVNGHLTVCVLISAPRGYKGPEQNALGNILGLCIVTGILAGVALDWLWLIGKNNAF